MKHALSVIFMVVMMIGCKTAHYDYPFQNPELIIDQRVDDLVSRLTLEEKISQMVHDAPGIERLGIPPYNWWNECLHGVARAGYATVVPQAIGLGATFNEKLIHEMATIISDEARAKHHQFARDSSYGIYEGLTFWSPNINIFRDPRWGRGQETYGEDPFLTSRLGVAFVKGLQGDNPRYLKLVATPKHYAVHSGPEPERHEFNATTSKTDLYETYLPAFRATVEEGKAYSVMGAYNAYNGVPACASEFLLQDLLREKWGFEGYVVSDCGAINDIWADHHYVETGAEAAAVAVKAGCELNCGGTYPLLLEAVEKNLISEEEIDKALKSLFRARFLLGMFDPPELVDYAQIPYNVNDAPEHNMAALEVARQSMVLLKNDGTLPLSKSIKKIAVVGPNASQVEVLLGNYNGTPSNPITPLQGLKNLLGNDVEINYELGCNLTGKDPALKIMPSSYLKAGDEDGLFAAYFNNAELKGEPILKRIDETIESNWARNLVNNLKSDSFSIRWTGNLVVPETGEYVLGLKGDDGYRLYLNNKMVIENWDVHGPETETATVKLKAGEKVPIVIEYFEAVGGAEISFMMGMVNANPFADALKIAEESEVILFFGGLSPNLEGEEMPVNAPGFEGGDRTSVDLPAVQTELLKKLHATGKPVILVVLNGSALASPWENENLPAILEAWYPGQQGGTAIAEVLFGDYNPAGRLPVTFYQSTDQLPPFRDYNMQGRTYRFMKEKPLYPFGFGLSYTSFEYKNLKLVPENISVDERLKISVEVTNTGQKAGDEVVQLYLKNISLDEKHPRVELKGMKRVFFEAGETKTIEFELDSQKLAHYDEDTDDFRVVSGEYGIMTGTSSAEGIEATFTISK